MKIEDHVERMRESRQLLEARQSSINDIVLEAAKLTAIIAEQCKLELAPLMSAFNALGRVNQAMEDHVAAYPDVYKGSKCE